MATRAYLVLSLIYSLVVPTSAVSSQEALGWSMPVADKFLFAFGDSYVRLITTR